MNVRTCTVAELVYFATELSAYDPDLELPDWLQQAIRLPLLPRPDGLSPFRDHSPARDLPFLASLLAVDEARPMLAAEPVQLSLIEEAAAPVDLTRELTGEPALFVAIVKATNHLGRWPRLRDFQRRRFGLPDVAALDTYPSLAHVLRRTREFMGARAR